MKIAIVILNWNGELLLQKYLPSVVKHSPGADIYVADNASSDDSVAVVRQLFPSVRIIQNTENGGFAKGYNDALAHVEADVYCLLNSDVEVTEDWLVPVMGIFGERPEVSIVQPKILDMLNPDHFEYAGAAGGFLDQLGYPFCRGRIFQILERDRGQYDDIREIFWATGACMFIRKEVFHGLHGFDEDYFAHQEEVDLCWRAQNKGHRIFYVGASHVYHLGGSTLSNMNPKKTFLNFRNSLYTIVKNLPRRRAIPILILRLALDGIAALRFLLQFRFNHFLAILHSHISFYQNLGRMLAKREKNGYLKKYYHCRSIVWAHFVNGVEGFNKLVKD